MSWNARTKFYLSASASKPMREYYYRPPEMTGEKIFDTFLDFQDERDIPVTQENIDNFFLNTFIDVCSPVLPEEVPNEYPVFRVKDLTPLSHSSVLYSPEKQNNIRKDLSDWIKKQPNLLYPEVCYDELYADVLEDLIKGIELPEIVLDVLVMPSNGDIVLLDDGTELIMPRIYLRIIE